MRIWYKTTQGFVNPSCNVQLFALAIEMAIKSEIIGKEPKINDAIPKKIGFFIVS